MSKFVLLVKIGFVINSQFFTHVKRLVITVHFLIPDTGICLICEMVFRNFELMSFIFKYYLYAYIFIAELWNIDIL